MAGAQTAPAGEELYAPIALLEKLRSGNPDNEGVFWELTIARAKRGAVVGSRFFSIANSQMENLGEEDGKLKPGARLEEVRVFEAPLRRLLGLAIAIF